MSDNTKVTVPEASPDDVLFQQVYAPEFVKQCQARGLAIDGNSAEDVGELLKIAHTLRLRREAEIAGSRKAVSSAIKQAASALYADTFGAEHAEAVEQPSVDVSALMANPAIAKAAEAVSAIG